MAAPKQFAARQRFRRIKRRITCDLLIEGKRHSALVTDLSANGLYVRTRHLASPGSRVRLVLHEQGGEVELDARVAREHKASGHHTTGIPSGLGLQIVAAPEDYFRLLAALTAA